MKPHAIFYIENTICNDRSPIFLSLIFLFALRTQEGEQENKGQENLQSGGRK
jgi:hypothetical protein